MSFNGKVVMVTGAGSGIGASIAVAFARAGAAVALLGRREAALAAAAAAARAASERPPRLLLLPADVTSREDLARAVADTVKEFGRIDVLVNNAGILKSADLSDENVMDVFDQVMNTNLRGAIELTHLALPHLLETRGNVVNISSVLSTMVLDGVNFQYMVAKAGMDHFTRSIALELGPKGVRVNSVNPGPVRTEIADGVSGGADGFWQELERCTVTGRTSGADEIADVVLFVASDKAKGITGSSFVCDNGMKLKMAERKR